MLFTVSFQRGKKSLKIKLPLRIPNRSIIAPPQ